MDANSHRAVNSAPTYHARNWFQTRRAAPKRNMRNPLTAIPATPRRRLGPSYDEMRRALLRLQRSRAVAEEARSRQTSLESILNASYTVDLPSMSSTDVIVLRQPPESAATNDTLRNFAEHEVSLETEELASTPYEDGNSLLVEGETDAVGTSRSHGVVAPAQENQSGNLASYVLQDHLSGSAAVDYHQPGSDGTVDSNQVDGEPHGSTMSPANLLGNDEDLTANTEDEVAGENLPRDEILPTAERELNATSEVPSPESAQEIERDIKDSASEASTHSLTPPRTIEKGKHRLEGPTPPDHPGYTPEGYYSRWTQVPIPGSRNCYILQRPSLDPDSTSELGEPLDAPEQVPTVGHLDAAARLAQSECIGKINAFLQENAARFDDFRSRRQIYSNIIRGQPTSIETSLSRAWDNPGELECLTHAVMWLDALLEPFRAEILTEDEIKLKPCLEDAVRGLLALFETSSSVPADERNLRISQIATRISQIRCSNQKRNEVLSQITSPIADLVNDLLSSAESIRYHRELGIDHNQRNDLVGTLRRIYPVVECAVPVGLSEDVVIDQPSQNHYLQYPNGPFRPYALPDVPEIFGRSHTQTRISSEGFTAPALAEERTALSGNTVQGMYQEMMAVVAAQKEEWAGQAKVKKWGPAAMSRDWRSFYQLRYEGGMGYYEDAARQRIQSEEREAVRQATVQERLQQRDREVETSEASSAQQLNSEQNSDDTVTITENTATAHPSPNLSDRTDHTSPSIHLLLPPQPSTKPTKPSFCPYINKPRGCPNPTTCPHTHTNRGKTCNKPSCKFARAGTCAFIHAAPTGHPGVHGSATLRPDPRFVDLKPLLDRVLAHPKMYRPCGYVNTRQGCKSETGGGVCFFNHSLRGMRCLEFERDGVCPRGDGVCPLWHVRDYGGGACRSGFGLRATTERRAGGGAKPLVNGGGLDARAKDASVGIRRAAPGGCVKLPLRHGVAHFGTPWATRETGLDEGMRVYSPGSPPCSPTVTPRRALYRQTPHHHTPHQHTPHQQTSHHRTPVRPQGQRGQSHQEQSAAVARLPLQHNVPDFGSPGGIDRSGSAEGMRGSSGTPPGFSPSLSRYASLHHASHHYASHTPPHHPPPPHHTHHPPHHNTPLRPQNPPPHPPTFAAPAHPVPHVPAPGRKRKQAGGAGGDAGSGRDGWVRGKRRRGRG